jgi:hypothetical protein
MRDPLEQWMAQLAVAPTDRALDGLEAEVGRDIAVRRREARMDRALLPARLAVVAAAVLLGAAAGGAAVLNAQRAAQPTGMFAAAARLAPSTLLDEAG